MKEFVVKETRLYNGVTSSGGAKVLHTGEEVMLEDHIGDQFIRQGFMDEKSVSKKRGTRRMVETSEAAKMLEDGKAEDGATDDEKEK